MANQFIVAHIIPTGVKADIGGYVGDATPATNVIAASADKVISHPNVVNGVMLNLAKKNVLYVEGYALDMFFKGEVELKEVERNRIGVVLDKGIEEEGYNLAINTVNALRTVGGVEVVCMLKTKQEVLTRAVKTKSNSFVGEIAHEDALIDACRGAIKKGAQALAISLAIQIHIRDLKAYFAGKGANPYGGAEAIISGPAYLGCVLQGLDRAPRLVARGGDVRVADVDAVVLPYTCMGGVPALAAQKWKIPIIAVKENTTVMKATPEALMMKNVMVAENYWEVGGILAAMKEGIDPRELRRPVKKLTIK
ncbi:MAG: DUF3326 domain-containing protein [Planctomycetes bacterium]|nr:DUF3326 domain-containing protein [Planctomycetota bacterium]